MGQENGLGDATTQNIHPSSAWNILQAKWTSSSFIAYNKKTSHMIYYNIIS